MFFFLKLTSVINGHTYDVLRCIHQTEPSLVCRVCEILWFVFSSPSLKKGKKKPNARRLGRQNACSSFGSFVGFFVLFFLTGKL